MEKMLITKRLYRKEVEHLLATFEWFLPEQIALLAETGMAPLKAKHPNGSVKNDEQINLDWLSIDNPRNDRV